MAGFFLGLAFYTDHSRRRVLGLFLCGVTLLFGFLALNTWLLLGLWVGAVALALCGFWWQDRRRPGRVVKCLRRTRLTEPPSGVEGLRDPS